MDQVKFISHNGIEILRIEYPNGVDKSTILKIIAETKRVVGSQPENSVLTLTVLGSFNFDYEISQAFDEYIKFNKPHVKAGAVVGVTGLKKSLYNSFMYLARRKVRICNTEEEAINFLVAEAESFEEAD